MTDPFVFMDLRTRDLLESRRFYSQFAGWQIVDLEAGSVSIPLLVDGETPWGGFTELGESDQRSPRWVPYISVDDLDAATVRAVDLGATVERPRVDLPAGSAVVITDPGGATACLWQAA